MLPAAATRQPDSTTCGPSVLVMAALLESPALRARVEGDGALDAQRARFAAAVRDLHRRLARPRLRGRLQAPWPRALGTSPWAVAHELAHQRDRRHRTLPVRVGDRAAAWAVAYESVAARTPVALLVGNRLRPAHWVLITATSGPELTVYDPSARALAAVGSGGTVRLTREQFVGGTCQLSGWATPWALVLG